MRNHKLRPAIKEDQRENLVVLTVTRRDTWLKIPGDQRGIEDEMPHYQEEDNEGVPGHDDEVQQEVRGFSVKETITG